ncbi:hypothetical protein [Roseivirga sp.]|uniref:hypothetical protein n=1 Tax=Roseivirga sp. TaxID=1964215 RepID=UPI003B51D31A
MAFEPEISNWKNRRNFESLEWKKWVESENTMSVRWDMRNDLLKRHNLVGMSTKEIIFLLGEPDSKSKFNMHYNLGMARFGIDTGYLDLTIKENKVTKVNIGHG